MNIWLIDRTPSCASRRHKNISYSYVACFDIPDEFRIHIYDTSKTLQFLGSHTSPEMLQGHRDPWIRNRTHWEWEQLRFHLRSIARRG